MWAYGALGVSMMVGPIPDIPDLCLRMLIPIAAHTYNCKAERQATRKMQTVQGELRSTSRSSSGPLVPRHHEHGAAGEVGEKRRSERG